MAISATQGKNLKYAARAAESWTRAQQKVSKLKSIGTTMVSAEGTWKSYDRVQKREFAAKKDLSITDTPSVPQEHDRRFLITRTYQDAFQIDLDDIVDSAGDIISDGEREMEHAAGRLCDRVILESLVVPILVDTGADKSLADPTLAASAATTTQSAGLLSFTTNFSVRVQHNCFALKDPTTKGDLVDSKSLEDILYIFRKRDAIDDRGELCCTLTPELARILRKDPDFNNAERNLRPSEGIQNPFGSFRYRGIMFITISESVLPKLTSRGTLLGGTTANTIVVHSPKKKVVGAVTHDSFDIPESGRLVDSTPATYTLAKAQANDPQAVEIDVSGPGDLAYVWHSRAILFGVKEKLTFSRRDELNMKSYAKQTYMRVNLGAVCIDSDYSMSFAVRNK